MFRSGTKRNSAEIDEDKRTDDSSASIDTASMSSAAKKAQKKKQKRKQEKEEKTQQPSSSKQAVQEELKEAKIWLDSLKVEDVINPKYFDPQQVAAIKQEFRAQKPFPHTFWTDFMESEFLKQVKTELFEEEFYQKNNDLYHFLQTDDLKKCKAQLISKLRDVLYSEKFRDILCEITGIKLTPLSEAVDMSGNIYQSTHTLLCHDDELDKRRIAYILYLVPEDWNEKDGGALDLFAVDDKLQPTEVLKSMMPKWNSFVFFEVSPVSYHQVAEVLSKKTRLSISGWFHGETIVRPPPFPEPVSIYRELQSTGVDLNDWINRSYRKPATVKKAAKQFENEQNIELFNFMRRDKYDELLAALEDEKVQWVRKGPAQKRRYSTLNPDASSIIGQFKGFLMSSQCADFINSVTGLKCTNAVVETRKFQRGDYTLLHDGDSTIHEAGLDVVFCATNPLKKWKPEFGGDIHYVDEGDTDELVEIPVNANSLSIVYRAEPGTMRFVKYLNHRAPCHRYDFSCVYRVEEEGASEPSANGDTQVDADEQDEEDADD